MKIEWTGKEKRKNEEEKTDKNREGQERQEYSK